MEKPTQEREIVSVLLDSELYLDMPLDERLALVKHLLKDCRLVP